MRRRPFGRGFSLVELMVTVAMVGILAVIALPSVMEALQRKQVGDASQAVLDLVEYARVQAASRNRSYEIVLANTDRGPCGTQPFVAGSLQVWENDNTSACMGFYKAPGSSTCLRTLDLATQFPTVQMVEMYPTTLNANPLCFKPDGRVFQVLDDSTPDIVPSTGDYAGGSARFAFQRFTRGASRGEGPIHQVVIPFSGLARVVVKQQVETP